ncbi:MAG: hypothetical protein RIA65_15690, partial [Woeseia sp.]
AKPSLAVAISLAGVPAGYAQEAIEETNAAAERSAEIEVIEVYGQSGVPYKALSSGDLRHTAELASTPQTITVLTQSQLRDSGKTDLKEILAAQAGITLAPARTATPSATVTSFAATKHAATSLLTASAIRA